MVFATVFIMEFIQMNQTRYTQHSNMESLLNSNHFALELTFVAHT